MLLSLEKKFLFVHVPKTAGTSLTMLLHPYALPRNRSLFRRVSSWLPIQEDPEKAYFRRHIKAKSLRRKLGNDNYSQLYKFATVRNPFDHIVSYYHFLRKNEISRRHKEAQSWSFSDAISYFEQKNKQRAVNQTSWLVDSKGEFIVDRILYFETIAQDTRELCRDIGIENAQISHYNASSRSDYREYYDDTLKNRVENLYEADFERFGYEFETPEPSRKIALTLNA